MDSFQEPFWNLNQVRVWAQTRNHELVRMMAAYPLSEDAELSITIRMAAEKGRAKLDGRDLESELWAASGWTRPIPEPPVEGLMENGEAVDDLHVPAEVILFPVDRYLSQLFRAGKLTAFKHDQALSIADWTRLELAEGGEFENVRVSREDVLREFPPDPPSAEWIAARAAANSVREIKDTPTKALLAPSQDTNRLPSRIWAVDAKGNFKPLKTDEFLSGRCDPRRGPRLTLPIPSAKWLTRRAMEVAYWEEDRVRHESPGGALIDLDGLLSKAEKAAAAVNDLIKYLLQPGTKQARDMWLSIFSTLGTPQEGSATELRLQSKKHALNLWEAWKTSRLLKTAAFDKQYQIRMGQGRNPGKPSHAAFLRPLGEAWCCLTGERPSSNLPKIYF